jgi:AcrR family transcriptional regulator
VPGQEEVSEGHRRGARKVPRTVREAEMLRTAGHVFARRGYHAASMDEIAEGAGVSKPMVYNYFGSKESLYFAYIEMAGRELLRAIGKAAAAARDAPAEQLWAGSLAFFEFVDRHRDGYTVLFSELAARGAPFRREVVSIRRSIIERSMTVFDEVVTAAGLDAGDVGGTEPLAQAYVGAGESLANWWLENPDDSTETMAARLLDVTWVGLESVLSGQQGSWPPERS